jgi:hypothetical protein
MAWFKVDDTLALHPKVLMAGNPAMGLWVRAGAWAMQQLSDGFVPMSVVRTLGTPGEAKTLVKAGLWDNAEGGYRFHEWTEVQRTKDQVKADREAAAERQRHARERAKSQRESRRDSRESNAVSHGPPVSRPPDQTRPDQTNKDIGADKPPAAKRGQQIPDDFRPSEAHIALASSCGIDLRSEWPQFVDHHKSRGSSMKDWDAALRTWIRNAKKFSGGRGAVLVEVTDPSQLPPVEASWMRAKR